MARAMLAAVFFIIIMTVGASAVGFQSDTLGHTYDINETVDASGSSFAEGELVTFENSNIDNATYAENSAINVYDENGVEMVEGDDYEWHEHNGTLTVLAGSSLTTSASLDAEYSFNIPNDQQQTVTSLVGSQLGIGQVLMYAFAAILAIAVLRLLVGAG